MTDLPAPRRYTDDEVRQILERATELESRPPASPGQREVAGPTLDELEEIAAEAGISVEGVRRAASELDTGESTGVQRALEALTGAPWRLLFRRELDADLSPEDLRDLVTVIEHQLGPGLVREARSSVVWHLEKTVSTASGSVPRRVRITLESRGGRTLIRIEEPLEDLGGGLFGGLVGGAGLGVGVGVGVGVGLGALSSVAFATIFPVACLGGSYALARGIFRSTARKRTDELLRVSDAVEEEVRRMVREEERRRLESGEEPF